ncbi:hypothetical protein G6F24_014290 [Rhizopus arrhizus]|nr:hypothetical protein G6F24_014290 [Rhizopus arrhizus]
MARRPQQQQVGMLLAQATVQVDHRLLLTVMGAGGDPHRAFSGYLRMELRDEILNVRRGDVELQVAQRLHLLGGRAQLHEALGIILRLGGDAGDRAQGATDQRCQQPIATQRAGRQAGIEDVDRNAAVAATEQHVRPQLGLQDQRQAGPEVAEEAVDAAGHVVRQVDMVERVAPQRAHAFGPGRGDGGDHPADIRAPAAGRSAVGRRRSARPSAGSIHGPGNRARPGGTR